MKDRDIDRIVLIVVGLIMASLLCACSLSNPEPVESMSAATNVVYMDDLPDPVREAYENALNGSNTETASDVDGSELYIPEEYYEVIDSIVLFVDNEELGDENPYWDNEYVGGTYEMCYYDNTKDVVAFTFIDIDGDNVAELVILDCTNNSGHNNRIIDFYTYYDDQVQCVFSGTYRIRYYLTKDLYFYSESSSGAAYSVISKGQYGSEEHKVSFDEAYYTYPINEEGDIGYYYDDGNDSSEVKELGNFADSFNLYGTFGVQESDFYDFSDVTTLNEYCESKEG